MPIVSVDIGTYTIKAIHAKGGKKPQILRTVEAFNALGMSVPTDDNNISRLAQTIETLFNDNNLSKKDVRIALPEQVVSTKIIAIPPLSDAELASAIGWQAEQYIPIPLDELSLEYQVLYRPPRGDNKAKMMVLLIGARKQMVEHYLEVFLTAGIEPTLLETQTVSTLRALQFTNDDPTTMVVSIGASTMDIAVVKNGQLAFSFSHLNGGQLLTRTIEQGIGLDAKQAEQYKRTYGLDEQQFEGKIRQLLIPPVKIFINEMMKASQFFISQYPGESIKRILLCGGTAQLPGLVQFITAEMGAEVLVAAPFAESTGQIPQTNQPSFTVCMGLIMREVI